MKIKSKSDVITNSSNEVFCFKMDEEYEELKREVPEFVFTEFKTWDDIRKYVTDENYSEWNLTGWAQRTHGEGDVEPEYDFYGSYGNGGFVDYLKKSGKTDDEIWDFFKIGYRNILGLAYYVISEGQSRPSWVEKYDNWALKKKLEKIEKYLTSNFKKGDVLAIMFENHLRGCYKKPVLITYEGGLCFDNPYVEEATDEYKLPKTEEGIQTVINYLDYFTARLATPEEISVYEILVRSESKKSE